MNYYDLLGLLNNASNSQILHAYGQKVLECGFQTSTSPQTYQRLQAVQQAFGVLSQRRSRTKYDAVILKGASVREALNIESLDYFIELHRLSWRYFFVFPLALRIKKIIAELVSRLFMTIVGAVIGFGAVILSYSDNVKSGAISSDLNDVPGSIKLGMILFALMFFFYKEVFRLYRKLS